MKSRISVTLTKASAYTNLVGFVLNNADFSLASSQGLQASFPGGVTNISLRRRQIYIASSVGAQLTGTLSMMVDSDPALPEPPTFLVNNIAFSSATLSWPTVEGPVTQALTAGVAMPMTGLSASQE